MKTYRLNDEYVIGDFGKFLWWESKSSAGRCWLDNKRMIIGSCKVYTAYYHYEGGDGPYDYELAAEIDQREAFWPDWINSLPQFPHPVAEIVLESDLRAGLVDAI